MIDSDEMVRITTADIAEVEVTPGYAIVTMIGGKSILIGVSAAHQLMQIMGETRLLSVITKYGDMHDVKKLH